MMASAVYETDGKGHRSASITVLGTTTDISSTASQASVGSIIDPMEEISLMWVTLTLIGAGYFVGVYGRREGRSANPTPE